jgi:hypothetical protein
MDMIYIGTHLVMAICITFILSVSLHTNAFDGNGVEISIGKSYMGLNSFRAITISLYRAAAAIVIHFIS